METAILPMAPQRSLIRLEGPDAQDFLHRITTSNVRALEAGQAAQGCLLTPQGKIRSFFNLGCLAPGTYVFELDAGAGGQWKSEFLAAIDQYTFAEKISLKDLAEYQNLWILGAESAHLPDPLRSLPENSCVEFQNGLTAFRGPDRHFGRAWHSVWGSSAELEKFRSQHLGSTPSISEADTERLRILSSSPRVDHEITPTALPLEIGLSDSIAGNKGCYPGQEVIEKIISLGSPPRRLARIEGTGVAPASGDRVSSLSTDGKGSEIGQITSSVQESDHFVALGIIKKTHAKEGTEVELPQGRRASIVQIAPF